MAVLAIFATWFCMEKLLGFGDLQSLSCNRANRVHQEPWSLVVDAAVIMTSRVAWFDCPFAR
jgi:hypothetical protein